VTRAPSGWRLTWHDEFAGATIDTTHWAFDLGNSFVSDSGKTVVPGWGNSELQCYTRDSANVAVRDGLLHVRATRGRTDGCPFNSARLKTRAPDGRALFATRYGRVEFRAKLPVGRGLWPALWMLPLNDRYGTWAASGEIDIMEARGQTPSTVLGTLHYGARWPANTYTGKDYILPRSGSIGDFHVYSVDWAPGRIAWAVDGVTYQSQSFWWSNSAQSQGQGIKPSRESDLNAWPAPFDEPFYLVMNLAVGGNFLGSPDSTTVLPAELLVDYVRVYDKIGGHGPLPPRGAGIIPFAKQ
jgi:beta-glucanase (GH16 family)